jgi:signal transduction histidine kinase
VSLAALLQLIASPLPLPSLVAIPIVAYSVARWIPGRAARIVVVIGSVGAILGPWRWVVPDLAHLNLRQIVWFALAWFVCMGLVVTPYAIGRRAQEESTAHEHLVANAEERYRSMATEREQQARLAESRARTQIARELHDIVAHSLSVMIVQAEGGRALAAKKPEAATQALTTIADTGREALVEMRRILGVLREEPNRGDTDFAPAPRLADIPDLVQRTGDRFTLTVNGQPPKIPAALELTVYRVVQEALTNVLKHAGPQARATVTLTYSPREIIIDVLDNGSPSGDQPSQHGHGLRGMHERVTSMGGRMVARPRPSGGFQVTVVLPLPAAPLR